MCFPETYILALNTFSNTIFEESLLHCLVQHVVFDLFNANWVDKVGDDVEACGGESSLMWLIYDQLKIK